MTTENANLTETNIYETPIAYMCDLAMHRLLCDDCMPDKSVPCEFYLPVMVDGRDMMLTFTATLCDATRN